MPIPVATWILRLTAAYLALGLLFSLSFLRRGIERLDPAARGSGWGFRLLVLPGTIALWPILLGRLRQGPPARPALSSVALRRRQRRLLGAVALLLSIGLALALAGRPDPASNAQLPPIGGRTIDGGGRP